MLSTLRRFFQEEKKEESPGQQPSDNEIVIDPVDERYIRFVKPVYVSPPEDPKRVEIYQIHRSTQTFSGDKFSDGHVCIVFNKERTESIAIHDFRDEISLPVMAKDARLTARARLVNMSAIKDEGRIEQVRLWLESNKDMAFSRIQIHGTGFCLLGIDDFFREQKWSGNIATLREALVPFSKGDTRAMAVCYGLWKRYGKEV